MAAFQFGGLVQQVSSVVAAAGTTTLTNTSKQIQILTVSGGNGQTYVLPSATTMVVGQQFLFFNTSAGALTLNTNGGALLQTIAPGSSAYVFLLTNGAAAGTWAVQPNLAFSSAGNATFAGTAVPASTYAIGGTQDLGTSSLQWGNLYFGHQILHTGVQPTVVATTPATAADRFFDINGTAAQGGNTTIATTGVGGLGAGLRITAGAGGTANSATTSSTGGAGGANVITGGAGATGAIASATVTIGGGGGASSLVGGAGGNGSSTTGTNAGGTGGNALVTSGAGGLANGAGSGANTSGNGGLARLLGGNGGAASGSTTSNVSGVGGAASLQAGAGGAVSGAATSSGAGNGGGVNLTAGSGGANTSSTGTNTAGGGGTITLSGSAGGNASGAATTNSAGAGSQVVIAGGVGGIATNAATNNQGVGGIVQIQGGAAGNSGTGAQGGQITLTGGSATGDGSVRRDGGFVSLKSGAGVGPTSDVLVYFQGTNGWAQTGTSGTLSGGAGSRIKFEGGTGGSATGVGATQNTGGEGANFQFNSDGAVGGAASGATTNIGGAGGRFQYANATGGGATGGTAATAGTGGFISLTSGQGGVASGASGTNTAGASGPFTLASGNGGSTTGGGTTSIGGQAAFMQFIAGNGGTASGGSVSNQGGTGGYFDFVAGSGGVGSGTGASTGGDGFFQWRTQGGTTTRMLLSSVGFLGLGIGGTQPKSLFNYGTNAINSIMGTDSSGSSNGNMLAFNTYFSTTLKALASGNRASILEMGNSGVLIKSSTGTQTVDTTLSTLNTYAEFGGSADQVRFSTAGTTRLTIDTTGGSAFTGLITAAAGVALTGGGEAAGRIGLNASDGIFIFANTGSSFDFNLLSQSGNRLISNVTGTNNLSFNLSGSGTSTFTNQVGIGTAPLSSSKLTVQSGAATGTNSAQIRAQSSTANASRISLAADDTNVYILTGGSTTNPAILFTTNDTVAAIGGFATNGGFATGGAPDTASGLYVRNIALTGANQAGIAINTSYTNACTTSGYGISVSVALANASFTMPDMQNIAIGNAVKTGGTATITRQTGINIQDLTSGVTNYGLRSQLSSGANKWNIYSDGTASNYFVGNVGVGTNSPNYSVSVNSTTGVNSYDSVAGKGRFVIGDPNDPTGYVGMYRSATGPANIATAGNSLGFGTLGDMTFSTGGTSFSTQTERVRIDVNGTFQVGATSAANVTHSIKNSSTTNTTFIVENGSTSTGSDSVNAITCVKGSTTNTAGTNRFIVFTINAGATGSGYIGSNAANAAAFFSTSDRRAKENIEDLEGSLDKICQLRPVSYDWKSGEGSGVGFIAQEVAEVLPQFVFQSDDGDGEDLEEGQQAWSMTESGFVPYLVKAIQELKAEFEAYKALHP